MSEFNKIKILTPDVYNKIAAGEVVEKPYCALKELVENSIDAGARRIAIEVAGGGLDLISVADNGCGIAEEDLSAAFVKHATSKLQSADDLYSVQTLGFRGEALSSIAAVSNVKLTTRQNSASMGVCVTIDEGKIASKDYVAANVGTKIEVRNLFYNVPARKKFLKSQSREGVDITKFVSKLILTNYNLEITYVADGKTIYQTKGQGLSEAIFTIYGADCLQNCLPVNYESDFLRINGYVGSPDYPKANSTYQTLSVNGRCVSDKGIQGAILQAYKPYLMTKKFPFFVLDINIPFDMVDVNVHPRKSEVRFENSSLVCGRFYRAVERALKEYTQHRVDEMLADFNKEAEQREEDRIFRKQSTFDQGKLFKNITEMTAAQVEDVLEIEKETRKERDKQSLEEFAEELERTLTVKGARKAMGLDDDDTVAQSELTLAYVEPPKEEEPVDIADEILARTRILGSAFRTYLILELDDKIILVDQHAAHERILFDKLMANQTKDMQDLLFPYTFSVKDDEAEFIEQNLDNILKAGLEVEPFGRNTFRIKAVAPVLADTEMYKFVQYLLSSIEEMRLDDRTLIVETIAKKACKAAVKAGAVLTEPEIKFVLREIYQNKILQCPHGRPITVVFTKTQLEKMFKRIV